MKLGARRCGQSRHAPLDELYEETLGFGLHISFEYQEPSHDSLRRKGSVKIRSRLDKHFVNALQIIRQWTNRSRFNVRNMQVLGVCS